MANSWEQEQTEESWSDREAWRGDLHADDVDHWRRESVPTWDSRGECNEDAQTETDWPEGLAGPEYWLFKRDCDP